MTTTKIEKIVVNAGVGRLSAQPTFEDKILPQILKDISTMTGQKPQPRRAHKSIAGFKMREGQTVGVQVTLRGKKMVDFFERLVRIVVPRVHDFRGIPLTAVDQGGVLNIGFREQFVFPELNPEESHTTFSLGINVVPRRRGREAALLMYREAGVPFQK